MKVDIWIYTDDGGERHRENMTLCEAKQYLDDAYFIQRFSEMLTSDFALDTIIEKLKEQENESNKN